jgi:hypothetical protein
MVVLSLCYQLYSSVKCDFQCGFQVTQIFTFFLNEVEGRIENQNFTVKHTIAHTQRNINNSKLSCLLE